MWAKTYPLSRRPAHRLSLAARERAVRMPIARDPAHGAAGAQRVDPALDPQRHVRPGAVGRRALRDLLGGEMRAAAAEARGRAVGARAPADGMPAAGVAHAGHAGREGPDPAVVVGPQLDRKALLGPALVR